ALARRGARAHLHAWRLVALHAADRHESALHVREFPGLEVEHAAPLHVLRRGVRHLAGRRASLAADAAPQIRDHGPARHMKFALRLMPPSPPTRARDPRRIPWHRSDRAT